MWEAQIPIAWVVGDSVYGEHLDLRTWLHAHGYAYVLEVPCHEPIGIVAPDGRRRLAQVADVLTHWLAESSWQRLSMSEGTKGPRLFDWACVPILHRWQPDGQHWLLLRRSVTDPQDTRYYLVFAPATTTLEEMVTCGAPGGISKKILKTPKTWGWITTRCAVGWAGNAISRWCCWPTPS